MPTKQTKTKKTGKHYHLEFSVTSAFFWSLGLFFLLGWIFVLGILVGRGFLPGEVKTLTEMKLQIAKLQDMVSKRDSSDLDKIRKSGSPGHAAAIEDTIQDILCHLTAASTGEAPEFPRILNLTAQGRFAIGFYQQKAHDDNERKKARDKKKAEQAAENQQEIDNQQSFDTEEN